MPHGRILKVGTVHTCRGYGFNLYVLYRAFRVLPVRLYPESGVMCKISSKLSCTRRTTYISHNRGSSLAFRPNVPVPRPRPTRYRLRATHGFKAVYRCILYARRVGPPRTTCGVTERLRYKLSLSSLNDTTIAWQVYLLHLNMVTHCLHKRQHLHPP